MKSGLTGSLCLCLCLTLAQPANAQDANGSSTGDTLAYASCSAAFHKDLVRIAQTHITPLRNAIVAGRKRDKSLPGKFAIPRIRTERTRAESKAIAYATRAIRAQGRESWLRSEGGRWLTDAISTGLKGYASQPNNPFLCTGIEGYLGYMEPHVEKLSRINQVRQNHLAVLVEGVGPAFDQALRSMQPVPLPRFDPRPTRPPLSEEDAVLRPSVETTTTPAPERVVTDPTTTGSVARPLDALSDLPPLQPDEPVVIFSERADASTAVAAIYARSLETGFLPLRSINPVLGTGGDPAEILINARSWVAGKTPLIVDGRVRRTVAIALTRLELVTAIEDGRYALQTVENRMRGTFTAIRTSHTRHCTCQQ